MKLTKLSFLLLLTFSALTKAALPSGLISSLTVTHPQYGSVIRVDESNSDGGSGGPGDGASNPGDENNAGSQSDNMGGNQDDESTSEGGSGDPGDAGSTEGGASQGDGDSGNTGGNG